MNDSKLIEIFAKKKLSNKICTYSDTELSWRKKNRSIHSEQTLTKQMKTQNISICKIAFAVTAVN